MVTIPTVARGQNSGHRKTRGWRRQTYPADIPQTSPDQGSHVHFHRPLD